MRLFVLGATGKTGTALVNQGLARGHEVTAFGRSAFGGESKSLRVIVGNPMDAKELAAALPGHDVVLSALGSRGLGATTVVSDGAKATAEAMRSTGLRRFLIVSSTLFDSNSGWFTLLMGRTLLRHVAADQRAMEELVTRSDLDWTVLRAARLTNGMLTGNYIVNDQPGGAGFSGRAMSREDLACMMLDRAERGDYVKQTVRVCGGGS
jgi:putative NADH-flavin reductase